MNSVPAACGCFAGDWNGKSMRDVIRWVVAAAALVLIRTGFSVPPWHVVLSSLLATGVLTLGLYWSNVGWLEGFAAVFVFDFVVGTLNTLDEAVFFHVIAWNQLAPVFRIGLESSVAVAALLALVPPLRRRSSIRQLSTFRILGFAPLLAFAYFALYLIAGLIASPYVIAFYKVRQLPTIGVVLLVELGRGFLYVLAAWLWLRIIPSRRHAAVFLGAAYAILGGIAPLLLPNPFMPPHIRLAHGFEVGVSNFVFGMIVGWILTPKRPARAADSVYV